MAVYSYRCGRIRYEAHEVKGARQTKDVSVIIPTYNEEKNLLRLVEALSSALKGFDFEIVVVDDDSRDSTPRLMDSLAAPGKVAALHRKGVRGIFSALRDGITVARGKFVVIMDADFSHPPEVVPVLLKECLHADIVVGSRFLKGSGFRAPFTRKYGPAVLNSVCRLILGLRVSDIFTGFHAMRRDRFMQLKFRYPSVWGEFDMELLYRAQKAGFRIKEVPFSYVFRQQGVSKSSGARILRYAWAYLVRAVQLRVNG